MIRYTQGIVAALVFLAALLIVHVVHIKFFRINVVFYAAIADAFVAAAIALAVVLNVKFFSGFSNFERAQMLVIWLLFGYAFAISVPTVIDRSLSFYILEKIQQRGGGIRFDAFEDVFAKEYVKEHRLVDVRLTEQIESGTIEIHNGCVRLTEKGARIASFGRFYRAHLLPKERLLMGVYTDDLTNPFRNSVTNVDYMCE